MVYFQFGNLDFMGSVSGNEAKNAQQHKKQLMNKLFIFVLNYGTNHIQTFNLQNYRVSKRNCSILSRTPCKDAQKSVFVLTFLIKRDKDFKDAFIFLVVCFFFSELYYLYTRFMSKEKFVFKYLALES